MLYPTSMESHGPARSIEEYLDYLYAELEDAGAARSVDLWARIRALEDELSAWRRRAAERRIKDNDSKLRRLIKEAERAARFLEGSTGEDARYRARELRAEIAAAKEGS